MSKILFAQHDNHHVLKFVGDIRVNLAPTLTAFLQRIGQRNETALVLDLKETSCMDSTCLGLLAKMALASNRILGVQPTLVTTNPDLTRVIDSMGFEQIFELCREEVQTCDEPSELPTHFVNEEQLRDQVLEAHRTLMTLSEHNENCFCDLVAALELEKDQAMSPSDNIQDSQEDQGQGEGNIEVASARSRISA